MKLSKYAGLVKRDAYCTVMRVENSGVWLGLRGALYCAGMLPQFSGKEQTRAILSLDEKEMDKVYLKEYDFENLQNVLGYNLRDFDKSDETTKPISMVATVKGKQVSALRSDDGELIFYDGNYLAPLQDAMKETGYSEMKLRRHPDGTRYIAVKNGLNILGIILPMKILDDKFLTELQEFQTLCTEQLYREKVRDMEKAAAAAAEQADRDENQTGMEDE